MSCKLEKQNITYNHNLEIISNRNEFARKMREKYFTFESLHIKNIVKGLKVTLMQI